MVSACNDDFSSSVDGSKLRQRWRRKLVVCCFGFFPAPVLADGSAIFANIKKNFEAACFVGKFLSTLSEVFFEGIFSLSLPKGPLFCRFSFREQFLLFFSAATTSVGFSH